MLASSSLKAESLAAAHAASPSPSQKAESFTAAYARATSPSLKAESLAAAAAAAARPALAAEVAAGEALIEPIDQVALWSARNWLNKFRHPAIEAAYRAYAAELWAGRLRRWFVLSAAIMSLITLSLVLARAVFSWSFALATNAMVIAAVAWSVAFWLMVVAAHFGPTRWLQLLKRRQQSFLTVLALGIALSFTVPLFAEPPESEAPTYIRGFWHAAVAASACAVLASSDLHPLNFAVTSGVTFVAFVSRNQHIFSALPTSHWGMSLAMLSPLWIASSVSSRLRDSLMRQNFVILQLVRLDQEKTILRLAGEKETLEVSLAHAVTASAVMQQHVKFAGGGDSDRAHRPRVRPARPPGAHAAARTAACETDEAAPPLCTVGQQPSVSRGLGSSCELRGASVDAKAPPARGSYEALRVARLEARLSCTQELMAAAREEVSDITDLIHSQRSAGLVPSERSERLSEYTEDGSELLGRAALMTEEGLRQHGSGRQMRQGAVGARAAGQLSGPPLGLRSGRQLSWHACEHAPLPHSMRKQAHPNAVRPAPVKPLATSLEVASSAAQVEAAHAPQEAMCARPAVPHARRQASGAAQHEAPKQAAPEEAGWLGFGFRLPQIHREAIAREESTSLAS